MANLSARLNDPPAKAKPGSNRLAPLKLLRKVPMFLASGIAHLIVLLILSQLVPFQPARREANDKNVTVDLRETRRTDLFDELRAAIREHKRTPAPEKPPENQETPVRPAAVQNKNKPPEKDDPIDIEIPNLASRTPIIAPPQGDRPSGLSNRAPGSKSRAITAHGGSAESESAVKAALRWLKRHQDRNGQWSCRGFSRNCERDYTCGGHGTKSGINTGLTGLALLAFLSNGNYANDGTEFGDTVARGIQHLLSVQNSSGRIGRPSSHEMYNHSIATLAIAEAHVLSEDKSLRKPLQQAVEYIIGAQQPKGGWDYTAARTGRNDSSITGFVVMALKSAAAADIEVPWMVTYGMIRHFARMTGQAGDVTYADSGIGAGRAGPGMVAVGALSRQFLGWPLDSDILKKQYRIMRRNLPRWNRLADDPYHNTYYWYYGTLAMFQAGGENWELWNARLRDMLVRRQRQRGCARGSWDPVGKWLGKAAGRAYATAINAMNLQVYYRYLPVYEAPSLNSVEALVRASSTPGEMRISAIRILGEFRDRQSGEALVKSLGDHDPFARLNAAIALLARDDARKALPVLFDLTRDGNGFIRSRAVDQLVRLETADMIPVLVERLNDEQGFVAAKAAEKLRKLCRKNFNYCPSDSEAEKERAVAAWREWFMKYQAGEVKIDTSQVLGSVINVRPKEVMLDVGRRDAVKAGDDFDIIRGGRAIARVKVFRVLKQFSAARITEGGDAEEPVREGDVVKRIRRKI